MHTHSPRYILFKLLKTKDKDKILNFSRDKDTLQAAEER